MPRSKSFGDQFQELLDLVKRYAFQELVSPLRRLGRYLGFGLAGAAIMTLGIFLLALSALRALQTQTGDVFAGWRSAFPYLIVLVGLCLVALLAATRIPRDHARGDRARARRASAKAAARKDVGART